MEKIFIYEAPETEMIDLKLEQGILTISGGGTITNATEEDYQEL